MDAILLLSCLQKCVFSVTETLTPTLTALSTFSCQDKHYLCFLFNRMPGGSVMDAILYCYYVYKHVFFSLTTT